MKPVKIFCTPGSEEITHCILADIKSRLPDNVQPHGIGKVEFIHFSNENVEAQVLENVRGIFVVVIHTQTPSVSEHVIELFALLDAISNSGASDILLVFPYMPFSRSDRKNKPRISTLGQLFPRILSEVLNVHRVLLLDPHDGHLKHYFKPTADEITAMYLFANWIEKNIFTQYSRDECIIVFADQGSSKRFKNISYITKLPSAYIDKDRPDDSENPHFDKIIGNTSGKICIVIDDEVLTGGTAVGDAELLMSEGCAKKVIMCAMHPILLDKKKTNEEVIQLIDNSPIETLVVTNSVPMREKKSMSKKISVINIGPLLAESICRIILDKSLADLHEYKNINYYV